MLHLIYVLVAIADVGAWFDLSFDMGAFKTSLSAAALVSAWAALGAFRLLETSSPRLHHQGGFVYLGVEVEGLRAGGRSTESLADPLAPQTRSGR